MKNKIGVVLITVALLISSCSKFQRVMKSNDMNLKFEAAEKYFENEDYYYALQLFEELVTVFRGTERAEKSNYYYAYCNYHIGDYVMAAYYFNNFLQSFPNSKYAEEIQFMHAYCYYLDSPESNLDQTSSVDAIDKFQLFINRFPSSAKVVDANKLIDELRFKLENKAYQNAKLYYKTEDYKAAIIALQNVLNDYPATEFREEVMFLIFRSSYIYAVNSVESKQLQRLKDARENYLKLVDAFAQSKYLNDAESMYKTIVKEIKEKEQVSIN